MTRKELRKKVLSLWPDHSAATIGRLVGGLTKNAVIGIANRERAKGKKMNNDVGETPKPFNISLFTLRFNVYFRGWTHPFR